MILKASASSQVTDSENIMLALQDQEIRRRRAKDASRNYYMPASADFAVHALHLWLSRLAKPLPWGPAAIYPAAPDVPSQLRRQMLERFNSHTKNCPSCAAVSSKHIFLIELRVLATSRVSVAAYVECMMSCQNPREILQHALSRASRVAARD